MLDKYKHYKNSLSIRTGKRVGNHLYIHKSAIWCLPQDLRDELLSIDELFFKHGFPAYNIMKLDMDTGGISCILSEDFDIAHEPSIDISYLIKNGNWLKTIDYKNHKSVPIYHDKWKMVSHEYKGFDYHDAESRSWWWKQHPLVKEIQKKDKYFSSRIGMSNYWYKLTNRMELYDDVIKKFTEDTIREVVKC